MAGADLLDGILAVIWVVFYFGAVATGVHYLNRRRKRTARTSGTVVRVVQRGFFSRAPSPDVVFVDGAGRIYQFESFCSSTSTPSSAASKVTVSYDPRDPTNCELVNCGLLSSSQGVVLLAMATALLLGPGTLITIRFLRDWIHLIWP
jgi:uncharacterized protein DUF3592